MKTDNYTGYYYPVCHSECVQSVERISRVRIVMEKEPDSIHPGYQHWPRYVTIVGAPGKFRIDVAITGSLFQREKDLQG